MPSLHAGQGWTARLTAVLGAAPAALTWTDMQALVTSSVKEDADLDFKREHYGGGDSDKRELAADVASLANGRGGLLLIGVDESNGAAAALPGVELSDVVEQRIRQVIASSTAPLVAVELHPIEEPGRAGHGVLALLVAPSANAPHAVRKDIDLRFPRRDGTTKRWLSESEVADGYRDRFSRAAREQTRLATITDEMQSSLWQSGEPWLVVGLAPTASSAFPLDVQRLEALQLWMRRFLGQDLLDGFLGEQAPRLLPAAGRVQLWDSYPADQWFRAAELGLDGAGACAVRVGEPVGSSDASGPWLLLEAVLTRHLPQMLTLLGAHTAENAGAHGDALLELRLVGTRLQLGHARRAGVERIRGTRQFDHPPAWRRTVAVEDLVGPPSARLALTRLLITDLLHAFGQPESTMLADGGALRLAGWGSEAAELREWAARCDVAVVG